MNFITRFAPSPTGLLHIGNVRTALIAWLYARHNNGKFMLRFDDTDLVRSKFEYAEAIVEDMKWLGLEWDLTERQSARIDRYNEIKDMLIATGRLYPCYESPDELELKRKVLLSRGLPPLYDRAALKLSQIEKDKFEQEGRKPHWRFLINDEKIEWHDEVKGLLEFEGKNLTDPVLIREDGTMTYILTSVVDDIDFKMTHIIRGEDHVTNTAIQIQIFKVLDGALPKFGHLALLKTADDKISKRAGGFDIRGLREAGIEAMAICSLLSKLGSSSPITAHKNLKDLADEFDIKIFGKAPTNYNFDDLERLNHKIISLYNFKDVAFRLESIGLENVNEEFWETIKPNLTKFNDVKIWHDILYIEPTIEHAPEDVEFLADCATVLPTLPWDDKTYNEWINAIKAKTGRNGKSLFMPIRLALTGKADGPDIKHIMHLLGYEKVNSRLNLGKK